MGAGIDVARASEVRAGIDQFGERYLARVFSAGERSQAAAMDEPRRSHWLAGRFAGKEAVYKALRCPRTESIIWPEIEILSADAGYPVVKLYGAAASWAARAGVAEVSVSITHDGDQAMAVASVCTGCGCNHGPAPQADAPPSAGSSRTDS